jgi:hypothetical protein
MRMFSVVRIVTTLVSELTGPALAREKILCSREVIISLADHKQFKRVLKAIA